MLCIIINILLFHRQIDSSNIICYYYYTFFTRIRYYLLTYYNIYDIVIIKIEVLILILDHKG